MRDRKLRWRPLLASSVAIVSMLSSASAEARPKKQTLMNKCSCACRQESATEVSIANKDFYSTASCGAFSGTQCSVQVTTSEGTRTVSGTWESCMDRGKAWVRIRELVNGVPSLTVDPGDIAPAPMMSRAPKK